MDMIRKSNNLHSFIQKVTSFMFVGFIVVLTLSACGPTPEQAREYKEQIGAIHLRVVQIGDSLERAFESYDKNAIQRAMYRANIVSEEALQELKTVRPITPDSILYKSTGSFIQTFRQVMGNEYREKMHLYQIPDEEFTYQNEQEVQRLNIGKKEKLLEAAQKLREAEEEFADRYNLKIEEF